MVRMRNHFTVNIVSKTGTGVVEVETRGYKEKMHEPATRECTSVPGVNALEWLLASLGACYTTMLHWHASKYGVTRIDEVSMKISGETDMMAPVTGDLSVKSGVPVISVEVTIKSPDDPAKIEKAMEFVHKLCPIGDTIRSLTPIEIAKLEVVKSVN